jgi:hypothetical protein
MGSCLLPRSLAGKSCAFSVGLSGRDVVAEVREDSGGFEKNPKSGPVPRPPPCRRPFTGGGRTDDETMTHVTRKFSQNRELTPPNPEIIGFASIPEYAQFLTNHQTSNLKRTPIVAALISGSLPQRNGWSTPRPPPSHVNQYIMACPYHSARLKFFDDFLNLTLPDAEKTVVRYLKSVLGFSSAVEELDPVDFLLFKMVQVGSQRADVNSKIKAAFEELLSREQGSLSVTYETFRGQLLLLHDVYAIFANDRSYPRPFRPTPTSRSCGTTF